MDNLERIPVFGMLKSFFNRHKIISIILFILFIKSLVWMVVIPPFQTPDEPAHFSYIQYLSESKKIPLIGKSLGYSHELNSAHNILNVNRIAWVGDKMDIRNYKIMSDFKVLPEHKQSSGSSPAASYSPLYYSIGSLAYTLFNSFSILVRVYAIRLVSVLFGLLTVYFTYLIGRKIRPSSPMFASCLSLMVGLHPMFSLVSISVNNDALLNLFAVLTIYRLLHMKIEAKQMVGMGVLLGLGLLIKPTSIFVVSAALFFTLVIIIREKIQLRKAVNHYLRLVIPMLIIYSPWAIFSYVHYKSILGGKGLQPMGDTTRTLVFYFAESFNISRLRDIWIKMFWADFGWTNVLFDSFIMYKLIALLLVITTVGVILFISQKKEAYPFAAASLVIIVGNVIFLYIVEIMYFQEFKNFMLQGRYLFTSIVPIMFVILCGIQIFIRQANWDKMYVCVITLFAIFNIASIDLLLHKYY
ncbi:DUF2142 domain-containing protein [Paenibacillus agricola]|uniref:DUF2142 domain-containing protein n=1 Tax=Paenibacillus agricola TaxID=2716264 RepID=A0ABX0JJX1_9BACL|nr:DUF2142 domain-containing protein [Paenibacillus agricola]NHN34256.1 DUF2142 domain-containing protein [Paenibacillus agricola]